MENSLVGAIAAGVVCGVLFFITIAIVCYLIYRCQRHEEEEEAKHHRPMMNGNVPNGGIPNVAQSVPMSVSRPIYQYPSLPVRHMASYRPRYIEERNPTGAPKIEAVNGAVKSQTYNGPYPSGPKGPVVYDVRQHGGYRSSRPPWTEKGQEEAVATMTLGEESPKLSERRLIMEVNNNRTSVKSDKEHKIVEQRSSGAFTENIHIPSPDTSRKAYLFTSETENVPPLTESANDNTSIRQSAKEVQHEMTRELSRRQRKGEDGAPPLAVDLPPVSRPKSALRQVASVPEDKDVAVYFASEPIILEDPGEQQPPQQQHIERYFINDDVYTVSSTVGDSRTSVQQDKRNSYTVYTGHGVESEGTESRWAGSESMFGQRNSGVAPPVGNNVHDVSARPLAGVRQNYNIGNRVIKSSRRPAWLQKSSQWFSKSKRNK